MSDDQRGTLPDGSTPAAAGPEAPLSRFERFSDEGLLGEGASGRVYKAYDHQLKRRVALKFLRVDNPEWSRRLAREAQAQARVEHPNVCKVYEVGEHEGRPYIAMQLVDGPALASAAREMSVEEKARLCIGVAEALHAAHKLGLIHRDIKPSNILVERGDGGWIPYVTDFGLARETAAQPTTFTGGVVGTPQYMPPEQARGDHAQLDRRSDVYSLGATLYELLVGHPPFEGESVLALLSRVIDEDPAPPRQSLPSLPEDLELIVLKCLEKQPQRRYETARALAEDLRRFLDGDPVLARRPSVVYRWRRRARKHKALAAALSVGVAAAAVLALSQLRARHIANERARLGEKLGRDTRDLESMLRYAYTLPLHDTRADKARVVARMNAIQAGVEPGAAEYVLGRGYLALHEEETARVHLEAAWAAGQREAPVAHALGAALGALYQKALDDADRVGSAELRQKVRAEAERRYRDPALRYLKQAGSGESPDYVEGLIAYYERRHPDALRLAKAAVAQEPWLYEALVLQGNVETGQGRAYADKGDTAAALACYGRAGEAYRRALEIARSDASVYDADCQRAYFVIGAESERGHSSDEAFTRALDACGLGLRADPEDLTALISQAALHVSWASAQIHAGKDPESQIGLAIEHAQRAGKIAPRNSDPLMWEAQAYKLRAQLQLEAAQDPRAALEVARQRLEAAAALRPDVGVFQLLGTVYGMRGDSENEHGVDPSASDDKAVAALEKRIALDPDSAAVPWSELGNVWGTQADWQRQHGLDPNPSFARAADCFAHAIQLAPGHSANHLNQGMIFLSEGSYDQFRGVDPRPNWDKAAAAFQRANQINPSFALGYADLGSTLMAEAEQDSSEGLDPRPTAKRADAALTRALQLNPRNAEPSVRLGELQLAIAEFLFEHDQDPSRALDQARRLITEGSGTRPLAEYLDLLTQVEIDAARWAAKRGKSPLPELSRGRAALARAHHLDDSNANVSLIEAHLERVRAELLPQKAQLAAGIAAADRSLALNPRFAEAKAEKGVLLLYSARGSHDPAQARAAAELLFSALKENPLLTHRFAPLREAAQALAAE